MSVDRGAFSIVDGVGGIFLSGAGGAAQPALDRSSSELIKP